MMFARTDGLQPLHRPQLVLLSAGEGLDDSAERACRDAAADGFDVLVVPWRSLVWQLDGAATVAGLAIDGRGIAADHAADPPQARADCGHRQRWSSSASALEHDWACSIQMPCWAAASKHTPREDKAPPVAGVLALAPLVIRTAGSRKSDTARRRADRPRRSSRVPASSDRSAFADPTRVVLAVNGKAFGFRESAGAPVEDGLFAALAGAGTPACRTTCSHPAADGPPFQPGVAARRAQAIEDGEGIADTSAVGAAAQPSRRPCPGRDQGTCQGEVRSSGTRSGRPGDRRLSHRGSRSAAVARPDGRSGGRSDKGRSSRHAIRRARRRPQHSDRSPASARQAAPRGLHHPRCRHRDALRAGRLRQSRPPDRQHGRAGPRAAASTSAPSCSRTKAAERARSLR